MLTCLAIFIFLLLTFFWTPCSTRGPRGPIKVILQAPLHWRAPTQALIADMSISTANQSVLKIVPERPGTSTLPTLSAKCWAFPTPQRSQRTAAHMAVALQAFLLLWVGSSVVAARLISLTVRLIKLSRTDVELVALLIQEMTLLELNVQVSSKSWAQKCV